MKIELKEDFIAVEEGKPVKKYRLTIETENGVIANNIPKLIARNYLKLLRYGYFSD